MKRDFGTTFVTQCAPVMAGLKAGGLFRWVEPDAAAMEALLHTWRSQLEPRGVKIEVLKACPRTHAYLIYAYRQGRLRKCTDVYLRCYRSGTPVTRLTVAG